MEKDTNGTKGKNTDKMNKNKKISNLRIKKMHKFS